jgi:hypothetical protein
VTIKPSNRSNYDKLPYITETTTIIGSEMKNFGLWIYDGYTYIFDSSKNPLRHIPDPTSRMFIMIILAFMWSGAFAAYLGSILYFGISIAAHIILLLMFFFTVAVFYDAEKNHSSWLLKLRLNKH